MGQFVSIINKYVLLLYLLFGGLCLNLQAQTYNYQIVFRTSITGTKSGNISSTGAAFHQLTWTGLGTISSCSIKVDSSSDGVTWNNGDIIAAQTCTSNGQTISTSHVVNFIRINVITLTGTADTLNAILSGYSNNPTGGSGNVTGSGLTSGNVITGANGSAIQDSGSAFTSLVKNNPTTAQTIDQSGATGGMIFQNFPCASLNAETLTNAGCTTSWDYIVVKSINTTANNLRRGFNVYYEGNLQQGNEYEGMESSSFALLDANSTATNSILANFRQQFGVIGNNITVAQLFGTRQQARLSSNAQVDAAWNMFIDDWVLPAGTKISKLNGIELHPTTGTVDYALGLNVQSNGRKWNLGASLTGSQAGLVVDDVVASGANSGICHGIAKQNDGTPFTTHDCYFGGTGSPNSSVTANIGAIYSQQNGTANTAFWIKESGTATNTGWVSALTTSSWAVPGTIGSTTPNTGAFTTLAITGLTAHSLAIAQGASIVTALTSPTTNGNCIVSFNVIASSAVDPTCSISGIPVEATNPATLLSTDRGNYLNWTSGSTLALPAITGVFANNFFFVIRNTSGGTLTITPNVGANDLIDGLTSGTLLNNYAAFVYQDSTTAPGHWFTIKYPTAAIRQLASISSDIAGTGSATLVSTGITFPVVATGTYQLDCQFYTVSDGTAALSSALHLSTGTATLVVGGNFTGLGSGLGSNAAIEGLDTAATSGTITKTTEGLNNIKYYIQGISANATLTVQYANANGVGSLTLKRGTSCGITEQQ